MPSLLGDVGLRLAAVGLALIVVVLSRSGGRREDVLPLPLRVVGVPDSLILATALPPTIDVRLRGSAGALLRCRLHPPDVVVDLSGLVPGGVLERELRPSDVRLPARTAARIEAILSPRFLTVGVDRRAEKMVPVEPAWSGSPPAGWALGSEPSLTPTAVRMTGPARLVEPVELLRTLPIDLSQDHSAQAFAVQLALPGAPVEVVPTEVIVRLALDPVSEETFRDIPVQVLTNRLVRAGSAVPARVSLTLRGPRSLLALVRPASLVPRVDARDLLSGRHFLLVAAEPPGPAVEVVGIDPDHVAVVLE